MKATIETLQDISRRCLSGKRLSTEQTSWLGTSLEEFLEHRCTTLDDALGLRFARGGVPWWRELAIIQRNEALNELAERFFGDESICARAQRIATLAKRYAASAWRHDRDRDTMPAHYGDTPKQFLWTAFVSGAAMPLGERQLRNILVG